jgi:hypothetical protein
MRGPDAAPRHREQATQLASDVEMLTELLHEEVIFTGPDGNLYSKQDDLSGHRSGHQVPSRVDELELRVLGLRVLGHWINRRQLVPGSAERHDRRRAVHCPDALHASVGPRRSDRLEDRRGSRDDF